MDVRILASEAAREQRVEPSQANGQMTRYLSIAAILAIMVIVHVDWHFGRGHHHHLSLSWPYHWITGLAAFFLLALFCARKWPENVAGTALLNGMLGLFAGQIIEPLAEGAIYGGSVASALSVLPAERWRVFGQFAAAAAGGLLLGIGLVRWRQRSASAAVSSGK
jgi:hypothetical protein